jgi:hypothetical protein
MSNTAWKALAASVLLRPIRGHTAAYEGPGQAGSFIRCLYSVKQYLLDSYHVPAPIVNSVITTVINTIKEMCTVL